MVGKVCFGGAEWSIGGRVESAGECWRCEVEAGIGEGRNLRKWLMVWSKSGKAMGDEEREGQEIEMAGEVQMREAG